MDEAFKGEDASTSDRFNTPRPQFTAAEAKNVREGHWRWSIGLQLFQQMKNQIRYCSCRAKLRSSCSHQVPGTKLSRIEDPLVNVIDILKLRHPSVDARGLSDEEFDKVFTTDKPGHLCFPWLRKAWSVISSTVTTITFVCITVKMEISPHHLICVWCSMDHSIWHKMQLMQLWSRSSWISQLNDG